jgi:hypothetical protein
VFLPYSRPRASLSGQDYLGLPLEILRVPRPPVHPPSLCFPLALARSLSLSHSLTLSRSGSPLLFLSPSLLPSLTLPPQDKIIEVYNKVFDDGLITSEADREAARSSR